ncbi:MAG: HAMP domain-containing histidine kinase [Bacteroidaceae bacterium]|nr:HAMP domain-containing histidine kinase [Bacteroidaceae bacterium]
MKRSYIWLICFAVCIAFVSLLYLQGRYAKEMMRMRQEQFNENVWRSLDQASRELEKAETYRYLQNMLTEHGAEKNKTVIPDSFSIPHYMIPFDTLSRTAGNISLGSLTMSKYNKVAETISNLQKHVREAYIYEQGVLEEVILGVMYTASEQRFQDRLNPAVLDGCLRNALQANGITLPFHFVVYTSDGREVYRCEDYTEVDDNTDSYQQTLFRSDPMGQMGSVVIHFPDQKRFIRGMASYVAPAMVFTIILLITSLITIYLVVRQKRISEMKNDFIHNMTHEFKTPISTISIAAQMLADKSVNKSEATYERLGGVITSETRRLRFQVEKVLQMSLFDNNNIVLKLQELDANEITENVVDTFSLKVSQIGGTLDMRLEAFNPFINADEMHFTNIIFNLLDNAFKYRRDEEPLAIRVHTYNQGETHLCISIADNGIGIGKDSLKYIFDKFYRVHTGDKHNVKGFGLGLAYVQKMVELHHGTIKVNSEPRKGTKFTITLPLAED